MNTPQPPTDHPTSPPPEKPTHGIPEGASEHETKGLPNSDRNETETAAGKP